MQITDTIPKLKPRATNAHKGDFGKVCIIAGSIGMSGAAALAGRAALRGGAGLVRIATPKSVLPIVASIEPSFTTIALPEDSLGRISAKAINPVLEAAGLSSKPQVKTIVWRSALVWVSAGHFVRCLTCYLNRMSFA
ncbi:MAG: NAD(P)H-hydrate dehydratase [Planctomycetota bacterium]